MSHLGDLIIEHGPYHPVHHTFSEPGALWDALRDELIFQRDEIARWRRAYARAGMYRDACATEGKQGEADAITEALRRIKAIVDRTDVNA